MRGMYDTLSRVLVLTAVSATLAAALIGCGKKAAEETAPPTNNNPQLQRDGGSAKPPSTHD
jgi:hypothetical protein